MSFARLIQTYLVTETGHTSHVARGPLADLVTLARGPRHCRPHARDTQLLADLVTVREPTRSRHTISRGQHACGP